VPLVRLFAQAREAAGTSRAEIDGSTVAEVLDAATGRFGAGFAAVLPVCGIWVNGEPAEPDVHVGAADEVAVLPPVSGGAVEASRAGAAVSGGRDGGSDDPATARPARGRSAAASVPTGTPRRRAIPPPSTGRSTARRSTTESSSTTSPSGRRRRRGRVDSARATDDPEVIGTLDRLLPRPDLSGPRVRLGVLWFLVAMAAATAGRWWTGVLWAGVAAAAAVDIARVWGRAQREPDDVEEQPLVVVAAAVGAAVVVLAAAAGTGLAGLALVLVSLGSFGLAQVLRRSSGPATELAVAVVAPAVVASSVVLVVRTELWAGLFLLSAVSLYDAGSFLMGAESRSRVEGPVVGAVGALAVTFTMAAFQAQPFTTVSAWVAGVLVTLSCPLGQMLMSAVLPTGRERVPAVRRLDAYTLAAPVMLVAVWVVG
jgi:molybdopterin converting factor small subunit